MTLTIHTEEDNQRQLMLTVEVPEQRVQNEMRRLARKFGRDITIPGFRKGKAPYRVLVKRIGTEALRADAVEELVQPIFADVLGQEALEPYGRPEFTDREDDPLRFKYTVPLPPVVELGNYRDLRKEVEQVDVSEEAVDEAMEEIREQHREVEAVERPIEAGDLVKFGGRGVAFVPPAAEAEEAEEETAVADAGAEDEAETADELDEIILFEDDDLELPMDDTKLFPGTPFVENLIGMSVDEEKTFRFTFPDDYDDEELAGHEAEFEVTIYYVQSRHLPELTDEFAQEYSDYENVAEWRADVGKNLEQAAQQELKNKLIESMIDELLADAEMVYPPAAVAMEIDSLVDTFKNQIQQSGWNMDDFLKMQGKTEDDLRQDFRDRAESQLRRQLALRQFVLDEKLRVDEDDIEAAIEEKVAELGSNEEFRAAMKEYYQEGYGLEGISSEVLIDKAYERMVAILEGNAPDLAELEALAAAEEEE